MKYFYNSHKALQVLIPSHMIPPTHPLCLVTPMTLALLLIPQSSSKFELLLPNPKCALLEDNFSPDISYCHSFATSSAIKSDFVIESSIIVVIKCGESLSKWHIVSS